MPQEIVLDLGKKGENKLKVYAPWITGLVILAIATITAGFFFGRWDSQENFFGLNSNENKSPTRESWLVREEDKFSIEYPENWKSEEGPNAGTVKIENDNGQLEIFLGDLKEPRFSKDQKSKINKQVVSEVQIDGRKGQQAETVFKSGEFFLSISLPATKDKDIAIFALAATNEETKSQGLKIIKTFKSK